jgi:hypothetical protein
VDDLLTEDAERRGEGVGMIGRDRSMRCTVRLRIL